MQQALLAQQHYAEMFGSLSYDTNTRRHVTENSCWMVCQRLLVEQPRVGTAIDQSLYILHWLNVTGANFFAPQRLESTSQVLYKSILYFLTSSSHRCIRDKGLYFNHSAVYPRVYLLFLILWEQCEYSEKSEINSRRVFNHLDPNLIYISLWIDCLFAPYGNGAKGTW